MAILENYNTSPPPDDGSQTDANTVKWATILTQLTDVLKAWIDAPDLDGNDLIIDADGDTKWTNPADDVLTLEQAGSETLRSDASGNFIVGRVNTSTGTNGINLSASGKVEIVSTSEEQIGLNRLTDDGTLVFFSQASSVEGSISVSGTTVSYNGAHLSFLSQLPIASPKRRDNIKRGTVMEYVNEKCEWYYEDWVEEETVIVKKKKVKVPIRKRLVVDGLEGTGKGTVTKKDNEQRMRSCVSTTKSTKKVAGIFERWDDDNAYDNHPDDSNTWDYDFYVATTGDYPVRMTGPGEIGDLLESNGDGTAIVQDDDIIHSSTIAKLTQDFLNVPVGQENPELVPCQLLNG